jgi:ferrous iron transport protein A
MTGHPLAPLDRYASGQHGIVREIRGGADFIGRLAGMGLAMGTRIEVLQNPGRGPLLVRVHETRIALGHGEAAKILVEEAAGEQSASS